MSSTAYGFVTINDHGDLSGDGQLTFSAATHTGRSQRSKQFDLEADHGAQAFIEVVQSAAAAILAIDGWEDSSHNSVETIDHGGGLYYMVGHANVNFLEASETPDSDNSNAVYTDLNSTTTGEAWTNGFTIIEASGTSHTGIMFEASIPYGTDAQYTFKIPVVFQKTNERREVAFELTDDVNTVSGSVVQDAEVTNENP